MLSRDKSYLFAVTDGGTAIVRDVKSHNLIVSFETKLRGHYKSLIQFGSDSKKVFFASSSNVEIWDIARRHLQIELQGDRNLINDMCFSADGRMLLTSGNNKVAELWDVSRAQFLKSFKGSIPSIKTAHFSDSGDMLDVISSDSTVRVWDAKLVKPLYSLKGPQTGSLNYSKIYDGGSKIVAGGIDPLFTWNLANGKLIDQLKNAEVNTFAVTPTGHVLVIKDNKSVLLGAGKESDMLINSLKQETDALKSVEFAESGRIAALKYEHKIKIVQPPAGHLLYTLSSGKDNSYTIAEISRDGSKIITCLKNPKKELPVVWEAQTGRKLHTVKIPKIEDNSRIQTNFSPDGKHLYTIHYSQLNLWKA